MLKMKAIDYDLVRFFVYRNNSFSIRCANSAIIELFAEVVNDREYDYSKYNQNWISIRNASLKQFADMIALCDVNAIEYKVM